MQPPTPADEAVRDLARARDDAREDLQRCRHRLGKLLLRRGLHYTGQELDAGPSSVGRQLDVGARGRARRGGRLSAGDRSHRGPTRWNWTRAWRRSPTQAPYREPVGWLRCFRGIDTLTAMLILAELHDFRRFGSARALMAFLGLVPGEDSSGEKHRRGRITKMGNALVRRVLVEASWHYQHRPGVGRALEARRTGQPARVIAIADKAQQRLVSAVSPHAGGAQAGAEGGGRGGARAGRLHLGRPAATAWWRRRSWMTGPEKAERSRREGDGCTSARIRGSAG